MLALATLSIARVSQSFLLYLLVKCSTVQLVKLNFIVQALHTSLILINDVLQAFVLHLKVTPRHSSVSVCIVFI